MQEKNTKEQLIEMLFRRLMEYNGKMEFSKAEIDEIMAIMNLLDCLDPEGKYIKASSAQIKLGVNHSNPKKMAPIIEFRKKGEK